MWQRTVVADLSSAALRNNPGVIGLQLLGTNLLTALQTPFLSFKQEAIVFALSSVWRGSGNLHGFAYYLWRCL